MKRLGAIYHKIYSLENLQLADKFARKGKRNQGGVKDFDSDPSGKLIQLQSMLEHKTYKTSAYDTFPVYEPKERLVYKLPYWPDRIAHWAIMLQLEPMFTNCFTADTYSCIKGRGICGTTTNLRKALSDVAGTKYCLKLDICKFYPNVNHDILKRLLRKKIKDKELLWLLDEIIDSADGLPIGNYLSQYFANFYLTYFDHWIKECKSVKYYFRYADDLVILSESKEKLHQLLSEIRSYLKTELKLEIKKNYQIFPVKSRGIDYVGFVHFHTHVALRKTIKQNYARMLARNPNKASIASYNGWLLGADCINLKRKLAA